MGSRKCGGVEDNKLAAERRAGSGPYGPDTCKQGYVWREATGDYVCVEPSVRGQAALDNRQAQYRLAAVVPTSVDIQTSATPGELAVECARLVVWYHENGHRVVDDNTFDRLRIVLSSKK